MRYLDEVVRSMKMLAAHPKTLFLGQSIVYAGNIIYKTLVDVPTERKIEMPVMEDFQMGFSVGLALAGYVPVTTYPRMDFLILACNQLVNHLDKFPAISHGAACPKVIIKTMVGSVRPLDPGHQHRQNHIEALRLMCKSVDIIELREPEQIYPAHELALLRTDGRSTMLVEWGDDYNEK